MAQGLFMTQKVKSNEPGTSENNTEMLKMIYKPKDIALKIKVF